MLVTMPDTTMRGLPRAEEEEETEQQQCGQKSLRILLLSPTTPCCIYHFSSLMESGQWQSGLSQAFATTDPVECLAGPAE